MTVMRAFTPLLVSEYAAAVVLDAQCRAVGIATSPAPCEVETKTAPATAPLDALRAFVVGGGEGGGAGAGAGAGASDTAPASGEEHVERRVTSLDRRERYRVVSGIPGQRFTTRLQFRGDDPSLRGKVSASDAIQHPVWARLPFKLLPPHIPSDRAIQEGWMSKRSSHHNRWHRRYFVATNAHHNYTVYYFVKVRRPPPSVSYDRTQGSLTHAVRFDASNTR